VTDTTKVEPRGVAAVRRAIHAFMAGDFDTFFGLFDDGAVYRVAGNNLVSGVYQGLPEIQAFFQKLAEVTEGTLAVEVLDILGSDNRALMIFRVTATRQAKDKPLDDTGTMAFRLNGDAKFAESWLMYSHQAAYDEFYS
jgi:ketosteroid isomerase-like protein